MSYEIRLEVFEGPLDLLLHLIHRNEVSITDIPIALITAQYLETIDLMKSLNLDIAGEYLVMAAYLTHIKSQMLLPPSEDPEEPGEPAQDPREELVAHLLEYKRYKEAAGNLSSLALLDRDTFVRDLQEDAQEIAKAAQPLRVGLSDLVDALQKVIARTTRRDLIELEPERLLVKDRMRVILDRLQQDQQITFDSLFQEDLSRLSVLTTFLALLELVKLQLVAVYQDIPFGSILISGRIPSDEPQATEADSGA